MIDVIFSLSTSTDVEHLVEVEIPALRTVKSLILDMIYVRDFGTHTAVVGGDRTMRDQDIGILFFPESGRAGITDNGGTHWTDALSVEDAERRYREDDMTN